MNTGVRTAQPAFTLAEVLTALALLGVIAAFALPKMLQNLGNVQYNAMSQETMAMVSEVFQSYRLTHPDVTGLKADDLIVRMNTLGRDTQAKADNDPTASPYTDCSDANRICYKLHGGGMIRYDNNETMPGNTRLDCLYFVFDPSWQNQQDHSGITIVVYADGAVTNSAHLRTGTRIQSDFTGGAPAVAALGGEPAWFKP